MIQSFQGIKFRFYRKVIDFISFTFVFSTCLILPFLFQDFHSYFFESFHRNVFINL